MAPCAPMPFGTQVACAKQATRDSQNIAEQNEREDMQGAVVLLLLSQEMDISVQANLKRLRGMLLTIATFTLKK